MSLIFTVECGAHIHLCPCPSMVNSHPDPGSDEWFACVCGTHTGTYPSPRPHNLEIISCLILN